MIIITINEKKNKPKQYLCFINYTDNIDLSHNF